MRILLEKLPAIYNRENVPLSVPFKSFIHHLKCSDSKASQAFWTQKLEGSKPCQFAAASRPTAHHEEGVARRLVRHHLFNRDPRSVGCGNFQELSLR